MSHEIRTPINGILGMAGLLKDSPLTPLQHRYLGGLQEAAGSLKALVNEVLDFSKIESGKFEYNRIGFDLSDLLQGVAFSAHELATKKGLRFELGAFSGLGPVMGDPVRLRQILKNLLSNALKFTHSGGIHLQVSRLERRSSDPGPDHFRFEVQDSGIGMSEEVIARIFSPFTQGDASTSRKYGGTGLGLSICRQLLQGMGGEIGVTSVLGVGSTFWFELPLEVANSLEPTEALGTNRIQPFHAASGKCLRVLLAEDNPLNSEIATVVLQKMGLAVDVARDGIEALEAATTRIYDLILMDCQMPGMDGYQVTRMIRNHGSTLNSGTPILAMTASAVSGDREKCLAAGMNDYLAKPIEPHHIASAIEFWLNQGESSARNDSACHRETPLPPTLT